MKEIILLDKNPKTDDNLDENTNIIIKLINKGLLNIKGFIITKQMFKKFLDENEINENAINLPDLIESSKMPFEIEDYVSYAYEYLAFSTSDANSLIQSVSELPVVDVIDGSEKEFNIKKDIINKKFSFGISSVDELLNAIKRVWINNLKERNKIFDILVLKHNDIFKSGVLYNYDPETNNERVYCIYANFGFYSKDLEFDKYLFNKQDLSLINEKIRDKQQAFVFKSNNLIITEIKDEHRLTKIVDEKISSKIIEIAINIEKETRNKFKFLWIKDKDSIKVIAIQNINDDEKEDNNIFEENKSKDIFNNESNSEDLFVNFFENRNNDNNEVNKIQNLNYNELNDNENKRNNSIHEISKDSFNKTYHEELSETDLKNKFIKAMNKIKSKYSKINKELDLVLELFINDVLDELNKDK